MEESKFFIENPDSEYGNGILLDEKNGVYSLIAARKGKDGQVYMDWGYPQTKDGSKKPQKTGIPWKLTFTGRAGTAAMLRYLTSLLKDDKPQEGAPF